MADTIELNLNKIMGFGGSKAADPMSIELTSSQRRPHTRPSSNRHKRPASSQKRPYSRQDHRRRRHSRIPPLTILEEVPEDSTIRTDISTLSTSIDHAENFYTHQVLVRRTITETILNDIVMGSKNGIALIGPAHDAHLQPSPSSMDLDQDNLRVSPILMKNQFQRDTPPKQRHGHERLQNSSRKSLEGDQVNEVSISLDDEISEESDVWGRKKSAEWKAGAGRKKSWKCCPVAKVAKKTQQVPYCKTK